MLEFTFKDNGHAQLLETDCDQALLLSSKPFPPGFPLEVSTAIGNSYRLKVRGSRKIDDSALPFRVEARFVNLSRAQREQLQQAFPTTQDGHSEG